MNLTNAEHDELFDRLGITETDIIENSVIASGTVRDMLEVLNEFQANRYRRKLRLRGALFCRLYSESSKENPNTWRCKEGSLGI